MPSRGNPNVPNKQRRVANRAKVQKRRAIKKVAKAPRGTNNSSVLLPTSGPRAPISNKKMRKLERLQNHARQRSEQQALEKEGEAAMTDAPKSSEPKNKNNVTASADDMEVDTAI